MAVPRATSKLIPARRSYKTHLWPRAGTVFARFAGIPMWHPNPARLPLFASQLRFDVVVYSFGKGTLCPEDGIALVQNV
jgi:hypothetical protein